MSSKTTSAVGTNSSMYVPPERSPEKSNETKKIDAAFKKFRELQQNGEVGNPLKRKLGYDQTDISTEDNETNSSSSNSRWALPPPTPQKKQRVSVRERDTAPQPSPYLTLVRSAENGKLVINGKAVSVELLSDKRGNYKYVYRITGGPQIFDGIPNENRVVKIYHEKWAVNPAKVDAFMRFSMVNYNAIKGLELPVATLYPSAHCLVQEYVPFTVDVGNSKHIEQVRNFFISSQEHNTLMDLYPDNLRVRKQGEDAEVILIDFFDEDEGDEFDNGLHWIIHQRITKWCELFVKEKNANREEADQFLKSFTSGFEKYGYSADEHKTILDYIFERNPLSEASSFSTNFLSAPGTTNIFKC